MLAARFPADGCKKQPRNDQRTKPRSRAKMSGIRWSLGKPGGGGQTVTGIDGCMADHRIE